MDEDFDEILMFICSEDLAEKDGLIMMSKSLHMSTAEPPPVLGEEYDA